MNRPAITNHLNAANRLADANRPAVAHRPAITNHPAVANRLAAVFSAFRGCFAILSLGLFLAAATPLAHAQSLAEALDTTTSTLVWTTGGDAPWFGQTAVSSPSGGADAAQSGPIGDNQVSWIETMIQAPASITFDWKVSSEASLDKFTFYVNNQKNDEISGEKDWTQKSQLFENTEWVTLRWEYVKDISDKAGQDSSWLDHVRYEKTGRWVRADLAA